MSCQMHLAIESARGEMQSRQRGEGGDGPSFFEAAAIPVESGMRSEALDAKLAKPQGLHRLVVRTVMAATTKFDSWCGHACGDGKLLTGLSARDATRCH